MKSRPSSSSGFESKANRSFDSVQKRKVSIFQELKSITDLNDSINFYKKVKLPKKFTEFLQQSTSNKHPPNLRPREIKVSKIQQYPDIIHNINSFQESQRVFSLFHSIFLILLEIDIL